MQELLRDGCHLVTRELRSLLFLLAKHPEDHPEERFLFLRAILLRHEESIERGCLRKYPAENSFVKRWTGQETS